MDDAGDPMKNYLGAVGLGYEIRGPVGQSGHLRILAGVLGHDDDRNQGQLGILLEDIQEGIAVHDGHDDVKQDQGNVVRMRLQNVQGCLTVLGLQGGVLPGKNFHQHSAVQLVVLDNQNFFL